MGTARPPLAESGVHNPKPEARGQVAEAGIRETGLLSYTGLKALSRPLVGWQPAR